MGYVFAAFIALLGGGAFWWRNDQALKQSHEDSAKISQLQSQVDTLGKAVSKAAETAKAKDSATSAPSETVAPATVPTAAVRENVIASITSGNTAALEGYMAASVHVVIAASSGVFDHAPAAAVADLKYIEGATAPWNFDLSPATLMSYGSGSYKDYFKSNSIVGKSANGKVVVFNFNDAGKINGIFMSASADLL